MEIAVISLFNQFIAGIGAILEMVLYLFPDSPFTEMNNPAPSVINLGWLNWLIPVGPILLHFALYLVSVLMYYFVRICSRWIKLSSS